MQKTLKGLLALSLSIGVVGHCLNGVYAKVLPTTGIKTEYQMQDLNHDSTSNMNQNLVNNGDFENRGNGWRFKKGYYSDYVHNGINQGYQESLGYVELPKNCSDAYVSQNLTLKQDTEYVLKAKVRVGVKDAKVFLAVKKNRMQTTIVEKCINGIDNYWEYQDIELVFNSGSHTNVDIAILKWTNSRNDPTYRAQVLVDHVELYQTHNDSNILSNSEFVYDDSWKKKNASIDGTQAILNKNCNDAYVSQGVTLRPYSDYVLNARVRLNDNGAYAFLAIKNRDMSNLNPVIEYRIDAKNGIWQDVSFKFNSGNNRDVNIAFIKWISDNSDPSYNSDMFIDNISLELVNDPYNEYEMIWADDFNGQGHIDKNGLNMDAWGYELGSVRGVEQQHYTKDRENVRVENGKLILEVTDRKKDEQYQNPRGSRQVIYNSGSVRTHGKKEFLYGRIEVLAKLPSKAQGVFPAFWTLGNDFILDGDINELHGDSWPVCGEIDIMEAVGKNIDLWDSRDIVYQTLHYGTLKDEDKGQYANRGQRTIIKTNGQVIDGETYHVFGINWSKGKIEWYIDDQIVRTIDYSNDPAACKALDRPQYIQLNFATGGNWPGDAANNLAGNKFKIEYAYYAQNQIQKQQAQDYYNNTVSIEANDVIMDYGTTPDLLKDVVLKGSEESKLGFTLDYSIDDEYVFTTYKDLTDLHPNNDQNETKVTCRIGSKTEIDKLKALEPGEYNLHISAIHDSKVNVRKTVKLIVK